MPVKVSGQICTTTGITTGTETGSEGKCQGMCLQNTNGQNDKRKNLQVSGMERNTINVAVTNFFFYNICAKGCVSVESSVSVVVSKAYFQGRRQNKIQWR